MKTATGIALVLLLAAALPAQTNNVERSLVEVLVTYQRYDTRFPWRKERPGGRAGYGAVLAGGRVLTTEDLVRGHTLVELRRARSGVKWPARVVQADYQANAALLEPWDAAAVADLTPLGFCEPLSRGTAVQIVELDESGQVQSGAGHIAEISVENLPHAPVASLTYKVLTDLKISGTGAAVLHEGRLAGLVMRFDRENQTSWVLPSTLLQRFVEDVATPPYDGVASAGLMWKPLEDPARRRFLGLPPENQQGVLVVHMVPGSGAAKVLEPDDVILAWGGHALDAQGYYEDPDYGRLLFPFAISGRGRPGETVPVTIFRRGERREVQLTLGRYRDEDALIPENVAGEQAEYLVEGGLVIRELTADYLLAHGARWMANANPRLVNLYLTRAQLPDKPGARVVILSSVLPDLINVGYANIRDEVITHVNGEPVGKLDDVFRIVDRDGGLRRLTLMSSQVDLVLNTEDLPDANRRLSQAYRIPALRYRRSVAPAP